MTILFIIPQVVLFAWFVDFSEFYELEYIRDFEKG